MRKLADQTKWMLCSLVLSVAVPTAASAAGTKIIYNFTGGSDGATPLSPLTPDGFGNVYGMTQQGGGVASCPLGVARSSRSTGRGTSPRCMQSLAALMVKRRNRALA